MSYSHWLAIPLISIYLTAFQQVPAAKAEVTLTTRPGVVLCAAPTSFTKQVSFSVLQDYPKGESLKDVATDFKLIKELGVSTWRGSFSWIDYQPKRDKFDYPWLHRFVALAAKEGITLRPYLAYTPSWAAKGGSDDVEWNDPPKRIEEWRRFVSRTVQELKKYENIASYEVYNEENVKQWWDGTAEDYNKVLKAASEAVRQGAPGKQVIMGGMVWPDSEWVRAACVTYGNATSFDVVPIHAYPETWTPKEVTVENYLDQARPGYFKGEFVPLVEKKCARQPIWLNEVGFATAPGKTEQDQANWWARAFATFLADPQVEHLGIYQVRDRRPETKVIGENENYYLGLTRYDREKKLAFHTVKRLVNLLNVGKLIVADGDLSVEVTGGQKGELYQHLFVRPDERQVLFVWDKKESPTLRIRTRPGTSATEYALDGTPVPFASFDGRALSDVKLAAGMVRIFEIR
ncbi:glycoside hydrolase, putative [Citrifermentans bemidjiense Bem]|uniref:Glycoside hydrolase, putative n=1 Tax=Citrifermentans bemidjiense (strain ATCC BAA-1014 / DSM 16622 / JCM 12645 / Bem) TaxID=404380 RepID=B5EER9_CITBB|nr:beta-galactosidase [Citrifermentans bemidjiense]ACH37815.1 glycoside hydrolase, putative [Citrifermentans bemidjiense Bem]